MRPVALKVGVVARRTGISVRTLHYYDEIGLLSPSRRTDSGHRLYIAVDLARLQQIRSLQALGFSLTEIRACLDDPAFAPARVIALHVGRLGEQIGLLADLRDRLEGLGRLLDMNGTTTAETFLETLEVMNRMEQYYTPEQLAALKVRAEQVGEDRIREVEAEWPQLIAEVRAEMEGGTDPAAPRMQALARRWMALVDEFTGGDPAITRAVKTMWEQEPVIHGIETAPMRDLMEYVGKALAAAKG